jgi:diguanylate cyclase (GGDEF)-like protein
MEEQANTDGLTGLLNHRAIQERLDDELARAARIDEPVAVLMIDPNRFKFVNDTFGHLAGDRVLQRAPGILRALVRGYDIVGRYGGDEFMVILPGADTVEAIAVAERIKRNGEGALALGPDDDEAIGLSVGLAVFPVHAVARAELIDVADRAMYRAKHRPRKVVTGPLLMPSVAD